MKKVLKKINKIFQAIVYIFIIFLFINSLSSLFTKKIPSVLNHNFFIVQTNSMEDTINVKDLVISKKNKIEDVKENDIISFVCIDGTQEVVNQVITHRVIKVEVIDNEIYLTTKGDNNPMSDSYKVTKENYIGKVVFISSFLGKIISLFSSIKMLIIVMIAVFSFIIIFIEIKKHIDNNNEKIRKEKLKAEVLKEIESEREINNGK